MTITQNHALLRVSEQDKPFQEWAIPNYKSQVLPSDIQVTSKMPPGTSSH